MFGLERGIGELVLWGNGQELPGSLAVGQAEPQDVGQVEPLQEDLDILKGASLQDLAAHKCDTVFNKVLAESQQDGDNGKARDLAYALFSGSRCRRFRMFNSEGRALTYALLDAKLSTSDLCQMIARAYESLKKEKIVSETSDITSSREITQWKGYPDEVYEQDAMVLVHHGGGRRHIGSFFEGNADAGYQCDSSLKGMFLTPMEKETRDKIIVNGQINILALENFVLSSRAPGYATRTPPKHCDEPQIIAGLVPKKYLHSVNTNAYEVVLKKEDAKHLELVLSQAVKTGAGQLSILFEKQYLNGFEDPGLQTRLRQSWKRLMASM